MLRRLLEAASTRASGGPGASSLGPGASAQAPLPTAPPLSLTGPTAPSSSGHLPAAVGPSPADLNAHHLQPSAAELQPHNATLYLPAESDELEYSILAAFSDMETVFLACISTLLPLIVALGIAFGIRHVWRKYKDRRCSGLPWYRSLCSWGSGSLHHRPHSAGHNSIQQPTQILSAQDLANGIDGPPRYMCESEVMEEVGLAVGSADYSSPGSHTSKNANGNIITLTLKNNHLIVETEERAVTMETSRSRKYEDNGCSVIVEVPPVYQSNAIDVSRGSSDDMTGRLTDQQALVHREEIPEDRSSGFENTRLFGSTNTGLSQSDLSICSQQGSVNPSYRYGNQLEYEADYLYCPATYGPVGHRQPADSQRKLEPAPASCKWVEFDRSPDADDVLLDEPPKAPFPKDLVQSQVSSSEWRTKAESSQEQEEVDEEREEPRDEGAKVRANGTGPGGLESAEPKLLTVELVINNGETNLSKPVITGAVLKDEASLQEDKFQEQQRKLGNGTLTPEHKANPDLIDNDLQSGLGNKEQNNIMTRPEGSAFVPSHKRSCSIPPRLIEESLEIERKKTLDIYSQIKTSTKSILPGLSPKFELLQNEVSPVDEKQS